VLDAELLRVKVETHQKTTESEVSSEKVDMYDIKPGNNIDIIS
jgi:hypothetical protein